MVGMTGIMCVLGWGGDGDEIGGGEGFSGARCSHFLTMGVVFRAPLSGQSEIQFLARRDECPAGYCHDPSVGVGVSRRTGIMCLCVCVHMCGFVYPATWGQWLIKRPSLWGQK